MRVFVCLLWIGLIGLFSSCKGTEDTAYLTPIPKATLSAYRDEMPVESKLQAVIAVQVFFQTTRLDCEELPKVISVDEITLAEAHRKVSDFETGVTYFEDRPGDTKVWLVMLTGEWRIIPPDPEHTYTPEPYGRGCAYVIIDGNGRSEMSTIPCSE